jgi:phospholipase/lecithinase/hemolysin
MAYTAVYVFGDSLVDSGNALKLAEWYGGLPFTDLPEGAPTAEDGYFKGRFSNGYTFADLVTNKAVGLVTKPVFPYEFEDPWLGIEIAPFANDPHGNNLNFAYGGSHIVRGADVVPDFDEQTDAFRHAVDFDADPNALYLITIGGNDIRDLAQTGSNPVPQAEAYAVLDDAADELLQELKQLVNIGARNIVITGIPDVGLIPRYDRDGNDILDATEQLRSAAATNYSIYLDTLIRTEVVPALQALGVNVTYVPLMDYVDASGNLVTGALSANLPTIAALHGLTTEELSQNLLQYQDLVFFDEVHPNAQANALLGAYMWAYITGTPWIETFPLMGSDVDYHLTAAIAAPGEVDQLVVSLVAGTTYTFEMLGVSTLGMAGSLADPSLRLLGPSGNIIGTSSDEGVGFDATLTFIAPTTGSYTVQFLSTGAPTGNYAAQAAVVSGAAMNAGNTYTLNSASTVVLESADGIGQDIVRASVSYALSEGSEIEVLRTTNDRGKGAINLTGNEFAQTIVGNAGNNVLEGKEGSDVLTGGGGKDSFILSNAAVTSPGAANIDRISDYGSGDVVDITQILNVAPGSNVITGGYLRVTTSGLVQVDVDGGGNNWVTLSSINNGGAVTVCYLSGGVATTVSASRVSDAQQVLSSGTFEGIGPGPSESGGFTTVGPDQLGFAAEMMLAHHDIISLI